MKTSFLFLFFYIFIFFSTQQLSAQRNADKVIIKPEPVGDDLIDNFVNDVFDLKDQSDSLNLLIDYLIAKLLPNTNLEDYTGSSNNEIDSIFNIEIDKEDIENIRQLRKQVSIIKNQSKDASLEAINMLKNLTSLRPQLILKSTKNLNTTGDAIKQIITNTTLSIKKLKILLRAGGIRFPLERPDEINEPTIDNFVNAVFDMYEEVQSINSFIIKTKLSFETISFKTKEEADEWYSNQKIQLNTMLETVTNVKTIALDLFNQVSSMPANIQTVNPLSIAAATFNVAEATKAVKATIDESIIIFKTLPELIVAIDNGIKMGITDGKALAASMASDKLEIVIETYEEIIVDNIEAAENNVTENLENGITQSINAVVSNVNNNVPDDIVNILTENLDNDLYEKVNNEVTEISDNSVEIISTTVNNGIDITTEIINNEIVDINENLIDNIEQIADNSGEMIITKIENEIVNVSDLILENNSTNFQVSDTGIVENNIENNIFLNDKTDTDNTQNLNENTNYNLLNQDMNEAIRQVSLLINILDYHNATVHSAIYLPQTNFIYSTSFDKTLKIWNTKTNTLVSDIILGENNTANVAYSNSGYWTYADEKFINVIDIQTNECKNKIKRDSWFLKKIELNENGTLLYAQYTKNEKSKIYVYDLIKSKNIAKIKEDFIAPYVKFINESQIKASFIYNINTEEVIDKNNFSTIQLLTIDNSVSISLLGDSIIANTFPSNNKMWAIPSKDTINNFALHPNGKYFAHAYQNIISLRNIQDGKEICQYIGHNGRITSLYFSIDSNYLLSTSYDSTINIWVANEDKLQYVLARKTHNVPAYQYYIDNYKNGNYITESLLYIDTLDYYNALKINTIPAFETYLNLHIQGGFISEAKDMIELLFFNNSKEIGTLLSIQLYKDKYPNGKFIAQANKLEEDFLYFETVEINTSQAYLSFLNKYPDSEYSELIKSLYQEVLFIDAVKTNNKKLFKQYLDNCYNNQYSLQCIAYLQNILFDDAVINNDYFSKKLYVLNDTTGKNFEQVFSDLQILDYKMIKLFNSYYSNNIFVSNYPSNLNCSELKNKIMKMEDENETAYLHKAQNGDLNTCNTFLEKFPNSSNIENITKRRGVLEKFNIEMKIAQQEDSLYIASIFDNQNIQAYFSNFPNGLYTFEMSLAKKYQQKQVKKVFNTCTLEQYSLLINFVLDNNIDSVRTYIKNKLPLEHPNSTTSALLVAVLQNNYEIAQDLVNEGANVNYYDSYDLFPNIIFVELQKKEPNINFIQLLLSKGTNPNITDFYGRSLFETLLEKNLLTQKNSELLIESGLNPNTKIKWNNTLVTPLYYAIQKNDSLLISQLLSLNTYPEIGYIEEKQFISILDFAIQQKLSENLIFQLKNKGFYSFKNLTTDDIIYPITYIDNTSYVNFDKFEYELISNIEIEDLLIPIFYVKNKGYFYFIYNSIGNYREGLYQFNEGIDYYMGKSFRVLQN